MRKKRKKKKKLLQAYSLQLNKFCFDFCDYKFYKNLTNKFSVDL